MIHRAYEVELPGLRLEVMADPEDGPAAVVSCGHVPPVGSFYGGRNPLLRGAMVKRHEVSVLDARLGLWRVDVFYDPMGWKETGK